MTIFNPKGTNHVLLSDYKNKKFHVYNPLTRKIIYQDKAYHTYTILSFCDYKKWIITGSSSEIGIWEKENYGFKNKCSTEGSSCIESLIPLEDKQQVLCFGDDKIVLVKITESSNPSLHILKSLDKSGSKYGAVRLGEFKFIATQLDSTLLEVTINPQNNDLSAVEILKEQIPQTRHITSIGNNKCIAHTDNDKMYKIDFGKTPPEVIVISKPGIDWHPAVVKGEHLFVYMDEGTIEMLDKETGDVIKTFENKLSTGFCRCNMVYLEDLNLLVSVGENVIQHSICNLKI